MRLLDAICGQWWIRRNIGGRWGIGMIFASCGVESIADPELGPSISTILGVSSDSQEATRTYRMTCHVDGCNDHRLTFSIDNPRRLSAWQNSEGGERRRYNRTRRNVGTRYYRHHATLVWTLCCHNPFVSVRAKVGTLTSYKMFLGICTTC